MSLIMGMSDDVILAGGYGFRGGRIIKMKDHSYNIITVYIINKIYH